MASLCRAKFGVSLFRKHDSTRYDKFLLTCAAQLLLADGPTTSASVKTGALLPHEVTTPGIETILTSSFFTVPLQYFQIVSMPFVCLTTLSSNCQEKRTKRLAREIVLLPSCAEWNSARPPFLKIAADRPRNGLR